ncbi:sigma 54-interacting transcriptional regulator [Bacillus sp. ISL-41]|uniref:sigma 54-interacting transcriptional regulator n=1 Tax=Bacillus sp. ISL-41 TaxID=2819127 RepID=UPI001BE52436|nr:sigma 54-interacting transcriptional regulator [Bacillus sp. ISL-41]MBT2641677.1 sigma 54-interacting transcriptional regulator [Bacillus sp. ISL-41]
MYELVIQMNQKNGLHVRSAASLIAMLQGALKDGSALKNFFVEYKGRRVGVTNLLSLVSLKVNQGEQIKLLFEDDLPIDLKNEITSFFAEPVQQDRKELETDRLLMENSVIMQEAVSNMPNGMIVVNSKNMITFVNEAAVRLLGIPAFELLNRRADEIVPHYKLHEILQTGKTVFAEKQILKKYTILANRAPIFLDGRIIGAVAIFQDISDFEKINSELRRERELQEQLNLVLDSVTDYIALTDRDGSCMYMNEQMDRLLEGLCKERFVEKLIGQKVWSKLTAGKTAFYNDIKMIQNDSYIVKVNSILIDSKFRGAVVSLSPFDEVRSLMKKLEVMEERTKYLEGELYKHLQLDESFSCIIGRSGALMESLTIANKVSRTISTVVITGESGTGKELVARAIHESSNRKNKPFIRVNCAVIPRNLIESELFGHEKGSFTGADKTRQGKFELADLGTIFLDEIGTLDMDLQAKLLRVLQEREFERVGGNKTIKLDVRIIAATNEDLSKLMDEKKFREDLYYRLNVIPVHLPPLRNRKGDIPLLADHFRNHFNSQMGKSIKLYEKGFLEALGSYHWPGNIRELQNIIERTAALTTDDTLYCRDLPEYILNQSRKTMALDFNQEVLTLEAYEKQIFEHAVRFYPSYNQLAKALGITHKTAASKLRKYNLDHLLGKNYQHT